MCDISHHICGSNGCEVNNVQQVKNETPIVVRKEVILKTWSRENFRLAIVEIKLQH